MGHFYDSFILEAWQLQFSFTFIIGMASILFKKKSPFMLCVKRENHYLVRHEGEYPHRGSNVAVLKEPFSKEFLKQPHFLNILIT